MCKSWHIEGCYHLQWLIVRHYEAWTFPPLWEHSFHASRQTMWAVHHSVRVWWLNCVFVYFQAFLWECVVLCTVNEKCYRLAETHFLDSVAQFEQSRHWWEKHQQLRQKQICSYCEITIIIIHCHKGTKGHQISWSPFRCIKKTNLQVWISIVVHFCEVPSPLQLHCYNKNLIAWYIQYGSLKFFHKWYFQFLFSLPVASKMWHKPNSSYCKTKSGKQLLCRH